MSGPPRVLVVGAGFSGAVLAVRLLRLGRVRVTLIERTGAFGRGVAYGTTSDVHRLNVRSCHMSAFPEDPGHFVRWLAEHAPSEADPEGFARRSLFGAYLGDVLRETAARAPGRLARRFGEVATLEPDADSLNRVIMGRTLVGRAVLSMAERAMETAGGSGFYRAAGLERLFRDIQGARYHRPQERMQLRHSGELALGREPVG